ncbi:MAG TPA: adenylate/guanylate cyclase domain-containing protein, partial [Candidatus Eremiobacteraceae bacterium]|nr:adenylate/guanylate cyclase domain-containing protein [Candidatus Eremiobacteraceae bacterium]
MAARSGQADRSAEPAYASGALVFLFTDIEGSTRRWEANRDAMRAAVERHDAVMREAIEHHSGRVFKTVGDAYCAVFSSPREAIAAALCAQRNLLAEDFSAVDGLRVRMGLHTGPADERDNDYFGPALNRVARLMSAGHGGQILISDALHAAAVGAGECQFIDLGMRRLKDLREPEHVWQATTLGLPHTFPPLKTLDARPNNLPTQATHLLGREGDVDEIEALLGNHRLVTLCGAGGIGKTRLALQAGADLIDRYAHGVWFIDLAPINDAALVESVIAKVLGIAKPDDATLSEAIVRRMHERSALIILDNCEHVIEAAAQIADVFMHRCPQVSVLATSRQPLDIAGEEALRIASLAVPTSIDGLTASEAMRFGAVALFAERARAAHKAFALVDENAPIVADICRRLDGIPLALELAAARVRVLTLPHLANGLNARFKILTHGSRTALPRQKTLSALIDWSYNLLTEEEQTFFNRLAVFSGDFTIEAADKVSGGDHDESTVIELLSSLSDKSLIVAETTGDVEHFDLLESTRAYALEKLTARGELDEIARRHALYYLDVVSAA